MEAYEKLLLRNNLQRIVKYCKKKIGNILVQQKFTKRTIKYCKQKIETSLVEKQFTKVAFNDNKITEEQKKRKYRKEIE